MKSCLQLICIIIVICSSVKSWAQDISISFSVDDSVNCVADTLSPYLVIRYCNNSSNNYYFPALATSNSIEPIFSFVLRRQEWPSLSKSEIIDILHDTANGETMCLPLRYIDCKMGNSWMLFQEECDDEEYGKPLDPINFYLQLYYNSTLELEYYKIDELNCPFFIRNRPEFVFLKSGKVKEQRVSLRGIKEVGIILRVYMENTNALTTVPIGIHPNEATNLPASVMGYSLYTGYFNSDELIVDFSSHIE